MRTDDLISLLAADTAPVARHASSWRIGIAAVVGVAFAIAMMQLTLGLRPDLAVAILGAMFWVKVLFPTAVAVASFVTLARLARPGVDARRAVLFIALPVGLVWLMAIQAYLAAPAPQRAEMIWGQSWQACLLSISLMSIPIMVAAWTALRQLAPTSPVWTGACAGALSGAAAAAVYAFHCPETALPFMAVWYVAGIGIAVAAGSLLGPRVLRW